MKYIILCITLTLVLISCNTKIKNQDSHQTSSLIADTIVYDVTIKAPNQFDDYSIKNLKYLKHQKLVDELFEAVYSGRAKAYHYYDRTELSASEIKDIEEEQPRELVGRLQFTETWYYNPDNTLFEKEVHSVLIAYERPEEDNNIKYYKAGFVVQFK